MRIALLAGGTGGAKLAAGMQELLGNDLAVIANTADDTRIHGLHVSPDPDLITYWLAGESTRSAAGESRATRSRSTSDWSSSAPRPGSSSPIATWPPASTGPTSSPRAAR